ncbi:MAG TPA: S8 family peptidase [Sphingomonas sp.]|jgi:hypothetical protein|uniref:S8 family peptidase n=1 Tax=Sphingomonas sp. TaxID=28214 RepID=UPI002ED85110
MPFNNRQRLFTTSALALSCALAAPAWAQTAGPEDPVPTSAPAEDEVRLIAASLDGQNGRGHGGSIRPFGGNINPNAGGIRGFAGPISGTAGGIRGFQGEITESAGGIRGFAGTIQGFAGGIRGFQLAVNPTTGYDKSFWGALAPAAGSLSASAGGIRGFVGEFEGMAGGIRGFAGGIRGFSGEILSFEATPSTYKDMLTAINGLVDLSRTTYGPAVQAYTGTSFELGFANKLLGKYGIDLKNPRSLVGLNELGIELFLMDWYDNLNNYSGQDQVDHWMKAVNWSPALTQSLGNGADTKIGILDFAITGSEAGNVVSSAGLSGATGIHGSAVSSLIVAKHDGRGVMGIAPDVSVISYNPFDATNTAGWTDIKNGVKYLLDNGSTVVNMSLGVPGYVLHSGWNDTVFADKAISDKARKAVFVIAAGNEGKVHDKNYEVNWDFDKNPNIIIVGSVDPNGVISQFSNRPGEGKIKKLGGNDPQGTDMLRDRFIVAPGEFMLVSDGEGGVTRMSGTSFAAPLVSGTIALVHDRWPWLSDNPVDTVNLILNSARDVGAAGTDNVYGRGMLDVQKALEPGNFFSLQWKRVTNGVTASTTATSVLQTSQTTINTWEANKVYFTVFEDTGELKDSYRDFAIPMSSKLLGQTVGNTGEQFNAYLQGRFWSWFNANRRSSTSGFATSRFTAPMGTVGALETTLTATPREWRPGLRQSSAPYDTGLALQSADQRFAVRFGSGEGATLTGQQGFGLRSDYDLATGGANPFLGLASGAGYAAVDMKIGDRVTVSTGMTRQNAVMDLDRMGAQERHILGGIDPYRATASTMTLAYRATGRLTANIGYTMLSEDTGLLGIRSLDRNDLRSGSTTDAATFGADYAVADGLSLALTGTVGRTRAGETGSQGIAVASGGLVSSAWQVAVAKVGLFDDQDRVRLTLAQPLHIERGRIGITGVEVIDRQTGELGDVTQFADVERGQRRFVAEALYGRSVANGTAQVNLFGRADLRADDRTQPSLTMGGSFRIGF